MTLILHASEVDSAVISLFQRGTYSSKLQGLFYFWSRILYRLTVFREEEEITLGRGSHWRNSCHQLCWCYQDWKNRGEVYFFSLLEFIFYLLLEVVVPRCHNFCNFVTFVIMWQCFILSSPELSGTKEGGGREGKFFMYWMTTTSTSYTYTATTTVSALECTPSGFTISKCWWLILEMSF